MKYFVLFIFPAPAVTTTDGMSNTDVATIDLEFCRFKGTVIYLNFIFHCVSFSAAEMTTTDGKYNVSVTRNCLTISIILLYRYCLHLIYHFIFSTRNVKRQRSYSQLSIYLALQSNSIKTNLTWPISL